MVSFDDGIGHRRLVDRVWGPLRDQVPVNRSSRAAGLVGGATFALALAVGAGEAAAAGIGCLLFSGLLGATRIGQVREDRRERILPNAADGPSMWLLAERLAGPPTVAGVVRTTTVCQAPLTMRYSVAYCAELRDEAYAALYLRDSVTIGFEIVTNDGRVVRVAPGLIDLIGGRPREISLDDQIRAYLRARDPSWRPDRYDPFPYRSAIEGVVSEGDLVALYGELEVVNDPGAPAVGYRSSAPQLVRAVGTPCVVVDSPGG